MRTLFSLIVVALLLVMPVAILADTYQLLAGNPKNGITEIGEVEVWVEGSVLYVKYEVDAPYWHLTSTHLAVGNSLSDIPQTGNNNPIPGQFPYYETMTDPDYYNEDEGRYEIPLSAVGGAVYPKYIAAHGVVCYDLISSSLPVIGTVTMDVSLPEPPDDADHIDVTISNGGILNGSYIGYCIDLYKSIDVVSPPSPPPYKDVSVSTNGFGASVMEKVNYVLNQDYSGQNYTSSDIQAALWRLFGYSLQQIKDRLSGLQSPPYYPVPEPDWDNVEAIVDDANANGEGFEPGCDGYIAIKLKVADNVQRILIKVPVKCDCATAWAGEVDYSTQPPTYAHEFDGKNWALYVIYSQVNGAPPRMSLDSSVTTTWGSIKDR